MKVLGIDIGGSGIKGAPVDINEGVLLEERHRIPTPQPATPQAVAGVVAQLANHFSWKGPIGCAFPAIIKHGIARSAANVDDSWIGTNAVQLFEKVTECPVTVINDADAAGLAEMAFGAGSGFRGHAIMFTFGTGIGSSFFMNQMLIPNTELGHLELYGDDAEHYAADKARKQEELTWEGWAVRVQEFLNHVEFLFNPDMIIVGGGVSKPKKAKRFMHFLKTDAKLVTAQLQNNAGIIGAAYSVKSLGQEAYFEVDHARVEDR